MSNSTLSSVDFPDQGVSLTEGYHGTSHTMGYVAGHEFSVTQTATVDGGLGLTVGDTGDDMVGLTDTAIDSSDILTILYITIGIIGMAGNGIVVFILSSTKSLR